MTRSENDTHAPRPGPGYWDWRCLVCDEPVADHSSWWRRLMVRIIPPKNTSATTH